MKKGTKPQHERNSLIVQLHIAGKGPAYIAKEFAMNPDRVGHIIARCAPLEQRRAELRQKYGDSPKISELPDEAPVDVLILCDANMAGWSTRVARLKRPPLLVKTLGDVRNFTDAELLMKPKMGARMLAQLRLFCPFRSNPGHKKGPPMKPNILRTHKKARYIAE